MTNWENFGEQIGEMIDRAIRDGDFSNLSRSVGDIVNDKIDSVKSTIKSNVSYQAQQAQQRMRQSQTAHKNPPVLYNKKPQGKLAGIVMAALGYSGTVVFAILVLVFLLLTLFGQGFLAATIGTGAAGIVSLITGISGSARLGFHSRYQKYIGTLKQQVYIPIKELAKTTGRSLEATTRDLEKMIEQKFFYQAHIDRDDHYLIVSDDAYKEYVTAKLDYVTRKQEAEKAEQEKMKLTPECRKLIEEGQEYVAYIRSCNDKIPDTLISDKLFQMERVVARIFAVVQVHPEVAPELNKLMSYYLPTTKKLLGAYVELNAQPVSGENIAGTKAEIEGTLDTLNVAFEKLLDGLYMDKAWDISSDISVLNTILAQDGLTEGQL